jgi:hypothetical protein
MASDSLEERVSPGERGTDRENQTSFSRRRSQPPPTENILQPIAVPADKLGTKRNEWLLRHYPFFLKSTFLIEERPKI